MYKIAYKASFENDYRDKGCLFFNMMLYERMEVGTDSKNEKVYSLLSKLIMKRFQRRFSENGKNKF